MSSPPPECPMHSSSSTTTCPYTSFSKPQTHSGDALSPENQMPNLSQLPAPNQRISLPTDRTISSIPKASSSNYWEYPSPQQFYNALVRKGWETPEESIETMVDIHNFLNEEAWNEILKWEKEKCECAGGPKLLRFKGRPQDLSPKARMLQWAGKLLPSFSTPLPFDRHDWTIDRCGKQVRYVIDYYAGPDEGDTPVFYLDVRPALDSFESVTDRIKVVTRNTFERLRERIESRNITSGRGNGSGER
ncbi:10237_t:CDS:2 [Paraglomus brasilianum]|uniref:Holocytochrome c-type synthase n=1 Tax=Paraglomus brasilianum TaxID=144538 RepID=A0A9N9BTP0_9GLOM|nr:10237_t:CDS:2 [Paraglomus brasilianum]